jgi:hypothetical protein
MGLECSPQLANLYAYSVESVWVDTAKPDNLLMMRFIDDILIMGNGATTPGVGLPSEEAYAMKYKLTSEATSSLIYLGVRFFVDDRGEAHCVLHDRAVEYPITIDRYPEATTVANPAQLAGVVMGRLVSAQRLCSRMDLFQDAVAGIFTHAYRRGYSRRMVNSVWSRYLGRYWCAASVHVTELRRWFHRAWADICAMEGRQPRAETRPALSRGSGHPSPLTDLGREGCAEGGGSVLTPLETDHSWARRGMPQPSGVWAEPPPPPREAWGPGATTGRAQERTRAGATTGAHGAQARATAGRGSQT